MKVFIAGPRAISELDENIISKLKSICEKKYEIYVGDADGIDSSIQKYLAQRVYKNVKVFASNGIVRNNYGNWKIESVHVELNISGFDFYAQKDLEMAKNADLGFMIWNGKSKGTFNNIINLLNLQKEVILYYVCNNKFYHFKQLSDLEKFLNTNVKLDSKLKKIMPKKNINHFIQVCLF